MFKLGKAGAHRHAAGTLGGSGWGGGAGHPPGGPQGVTGRASQPKGRTPIQAPCAQKAKPAQAAAPATTATSVGTRRPAG